MSRIYYCSACKEKLTWPASKGRKKETVCNICGEHAACFGGDTARLPNREKAREAPQEKVSARPKIRKPVPEEAKAERASGLKVEGLENVVPLLPLREKKSQRKEPEVDVMSLTADDLRCRRDGVTGTLVEAHIRKIMSSAFAAAAEGSITYTLETPNKTVVERVISELQQEKLLSVEALEEDDFKHVLRISW